MPSYERFSYYLEYRHAFDFDAASEAFQEYLRGAGVDFNPEETTSTVSDVAEERYGIPRRIYIRRTATYEQ